MRYLVTGGAGFMARIRSMSWCAEATMWLCWTTCRAEKSRT